MPVQPLPGTRDQVRVELVELIWIQNDTLWIIVDWRVCRAHACQIQNVGAEVLFGARR